MFRVILPIAALALSACGPHGNPTAAAAQSASKLLTAAAAQDRVALEAQIDRSAVRDDLRRQVVEAGQQYGVAVDGGPSDFTLDRMVGPEALMRAAARDALSRPTPDQLLPLLKVVDRSHVCLRDVADPNACVLTFGKRRGGWRLVGMQAMGLAQPAIGD